MGIFNTLFGKDISKEKNESKIVPWISLETIEQLEEIKEKSISKPQLIFKHSTTCGISRMVMNRFNEGFKLSKDSFEFYYLDLHKYRAVSNEISTMFGVLHESPQLLIIKDGSVVVHESHGAITQLDLVKYL